MFTWKISCFGKASQRKALTVLLDDGGFDFSLQVSEILDEIPNSGNSF